MGKYDGGRRAVLHALPQSPRRQSRRVRSASPRIPVRARRGQPAGAIVMLQQNRKMEFFLLFF